MKNEMKRGIGVVLAATMVTSTMSVGYGGQTVYAEDVPSDTREIMTQSFVPNTEEIPDNRTLFEGYVQKTLYGTNGFAFFKNFAENVLTGVNKKVYDQVKKAIVSVASGKDSAGNATEGNISTEFMTEVDAASLQQFNLNTVMQALLVDCPYELYWFDKTEGIQAKLQQVGNKGKITLSFSVAKGYAGTAAYTVNGKKAGATLAAAEAAQRIVEKHKAETDLAKLTSYKEEICKLVDYNYQAAGENYTDGYGDPWQLIYVFDGVEETKVVCEGYAKAFQYLCDLSEFRDSSFACYTVDGLMGGGTGAGAHMWNIVTLGGENYLVDITNSDDGTVGNDGSLFMAWTTQGNMNDGYRFQAQNSYISYSYDKEMFDFYGEQILTIANSEYVPSVEEKVVIKTQPKNPAAVTYGYENAPEMRVEAEKPAGVTGAITYQWYHGDKTKIEGATGAAYVPKNLDAGTHTFYCAVSCDGYTVNSSVVTVTVNKASSAVLEISKMDKTYDKTAVKAPEYTKIGDGAVSIEYKEKGTSDASYTKTIPVSAGKYTVRVSVAETKNYKAGSATADFEIVAKPLTITVKVKDKEYDRTKTAEIEHAVLNGVVAGDEVVLQNGTLEFTSAEMGENIPIVFVKPFAITGAEKGNYVLTQPTGVTASIGAYVADKGSDYTVNSNDWQKDDFVVTVAEGKKVSLSDNESAVWTDTLTVSEELEGSLKFYIKDVKTGAISLPVIENYKIDKTAPDGDISYNGNSVKRLLAEVKFEQMFNADMNVKLAGTDGLSGVESVSYYLSRSILTEDEVKNIKDWKGGKEFFIEANDQQQFVVYVKVADKAGNVAYFASAGSEFDTSIPKVAGVKDGETYYATRKVTVSDKNLISVTVNGVVSEREFTFSGVDEVTEFIIEAVDQAGNHFSYKVTMSPVSALSNQIEGLNLENVTAQDQTLLESVLSEAKENMTYATEEEKGALNDVIVACNSLLSKVSVINELERITNELKKYHLDSLKKSDKANIEQLVKDMDALLLKETLDEEERAAIKDMKKQAEQFLKVIEKLPTEQKEEQKTTISKEEKKENAKKIPNTGDFVSLWGWLAGLAAGVTTVGAHVKRRKEEGHQDNQN